MCADVPSIEARLDLFRYRRVLGRRDKELSLRLLKPASLVAIAAAVFTAVGIAAWLGPDVRVGLARDTSGMWDFIRNNGASGARGASPWRAEQQSAAPVVNDAAPARVARADRRPSRKIARKAPASPPVRTVAAAAPAQPGQVVCVRLCDGFFFPLGNLQKASDLPGQEAVCHSLCPGAPVRAFAVPAGADTIDRAASRDGRLYSALPVAFRHMHTADDTCTCHAPNEGLLLALMRDVTLRRGDAVATANGVRVFKGAKHWPYQNNDFLSLAAARGFEPKAAALQAIERAIKLPQTPGPARALTLAPPAKKPRPEVAATLLPDVGGHRIRFIGTDTTPAL